MSVVREPACHLEIQRNPAYQRKVNPKYLSRIRALPASLHPSLRARALNPSTTEDTRPFEINPSGKHRYVARRIRTADGTRKWENFGPVAEVLEILDFLHPPIVAEKSKNDPGAVEHRVQTTTAPFPAVGAHGQEKICASEPPNDSPFDHRGRRLTIGPMWTCMAALLLGALILTGAIWSKSMTTPKQPALLAPRAVGQLIDHQVAGLGTSASDKNRPVVRSVKNALSTAPDKAPAPSIESLVDAPLKSARLAELSREMQSMDAQDVRYRRLFMLFETATVLSIKPARALVFRDAMPIADGRIVEISGRELFDPPGQIRPVLPKLLRSVWEAAGRSAVAAELRDALMSSVTAVAYRSNSVREQLVFRTGTQRLANAFRAAHGVPRSLTTWRDPNSGWNYAIIGTCVVITE